MDKRIVVATVVYYDGVEAYTTHRALWVDCSDKLKLTAQSKKALARDLESACVELLKVDFNGQTFTSGVEFMREYKAEQRTAFAKEHDETEYIKEKFVEYYC